MIPLPNEELTQLLANLPATPGASDCQAVAKKLLPYMSRHVPPMGGGHSDSRLYFLTTVARYNLCLARLIEGHLDATQILHDAHRPVADNLIYAIWASGGPDDTLVLKHNSSDGNALELSGCKPFCSGSDLVDRALVHLSSGQQLVEINMSARESARHLRYERGLWQSPAFEETHTWTVEFDALPITTEDLIGESAWYFERPGFCLGALAPAACWLGGAMGLVDSARRRPLKGGHAKAHLGAMVATVCSMRSILKWGAEQADGDPQNKSGHMFPAALLVRHHVERGCAEILDRFGRTLGPRPYAFEAANIQRVAELSMYIRQCHAERDLEELGDYLIAHKEFCEF